MSAPTSRVFPILGDIKVAAGVDSDIAGIGHRSASGGAVTGVAATSGQGCDHPIGDLSDAVVRRVGDWITCSNRFGKGMATILRNSPSAMRTCTGANSRSAGRQ